MKTNSATMVVYKFLKNEIDLPYSPAVLLLGICPKDPKSACHRDVCTSMFTAASLTTTKIWNQPVSSNRGMDRENMVCTHNGTCSHKEEQSRVICRDMDTTEDDHIK